MLHILKGDIIDSEDAWILMSLVRQIRQWGLTEFSDFVVQHMRQWNKYYEERVLALENKGKENRERMKKRDRERVVEPSKPSTVDLKQLRNLPHPWWVCSRSFDRIRSLKRVKTVKRWMSTEEDMENG